MDAITIRDALNTAMRHSTAPMVLADPRQPDCPLVVVNRAFCELTGYAEAEIVGRNCRFLQGPGTDPRSRPRLRACLEAGDGCVEWIMNYRRDGTPFWNLLFIAPIHDAAGELVYFFASQFDITAGSPDWLIEIELGRAHLLPEQERELHALLQGVVETEMSADGPAAASALERVVAAAHRLAEISTQLAPGRLAAIRAAAR